MDIDREAVMIGKREELGATIVELLMGLAIFMVLVNTGAQLFIGAMRLHNAGEAALDSIANLEHVRHDFLELARESKGLAASAAEYQRKESLSVWRLDDGRFGLLGHLTDDGPPVSCVVERAGDAWEMTSYSVLPRTVESLRFDYADAGAVRLTVTVENLGMENTVPRENVFVCALRISETDAEVVELGDEL